MYLMLSLSGISRCTKTIPLNEVKGGASEGVGVGPDFISILPGAQLGVDEIVHVQEFCISLIKKCSPQPPLQHQVTIQYFPFSVIKCKCLNKN